MTGCNGHEDEDDDEDDDEPAGIGFIYCLFNDTLSFSDYTASKPLLVASRSEVWICGHSLPGIAGSNPAGGRDVCLL
jgi:hypothetical protein